MVGGSVSLWLLVCPGRAIICARNTPCRKAIPWVPRILKSGAYESFLEWWRLRPKAHCRRLTRASQELLNDQWGIVWPLGLDPQYLHLGPFPLWPQHARIHRRSPAPSNPSLPNSLPPLAMRPAFRVSDYYGGSATPRPAQPTTNHTRNRPGRPTTGPARDASHVDRTPVDGVSAQLCPRDIATSTPQPFLVASLPALSTGPGVAHHRRACIAPQPKSTRLEPTYLLRGVTRWFLTYTFPSR